MQRYITLRLGQGVLVVGIVVILVFLLARATGDPAYLILGDEARPEDVQRLRERLGLDRPMLVQLGDYLRKLAIGDMGVSIRYQRPALQLYLEALPNTLGLAGISVVVALATAIPLGVLSAVKRGTFIDRAATVISVLGLAMPTFWLAIMLIYVFGMQLNWLPAGLQGGPSHYVLPVVAMSTGAMAAVTRVVRSSMLDVLDSEYVKLARIKGSADSVIYWRHAFRNAVIPVLTLSGLLLSVLVTGAIVTETVFAWPGVGRLTFQAVQYRDYELLQATIVVTTAFIVLVNLVVDVLYAFVDPRIRYG